MASRDVHAVLKVLPVLDNNDLQAVALRIKSLLGTLPLGDTEALDTTAQAYDYLLEGIHTELRRRGLLGTAYRLPKRIFPPNYQRTSLEVRALFARYLPRLRSEEQAALGQLSAWALAHWLESRNNPIVITPRIMLLNVGNIPVGLDHSFPGYLAAGLLSLCWFKPK